MNPQNQHPLPPELQEMQTQCYTRTPEQQLDEEEMMMMEWLRSMHPSQRKTAERQLSYGRWLDSTPENKPAYPF
jgi:hypothetical protein